jgi:hypothetical protein
MYGSYGENTNLSPHLYFQYVVMNNPAKVIGIESNPTSPNTNQVFGRSKYIGLFPRSPYLLSIEQLKVPPFGRGSFRAVGRTPI